MLKKENPKTDEEIEPILLNMYNLKLILSMEVYPIFFYFST